MKAHLHSILGLLLLGWPVSQARCQAKPVRTVSKTSTAAPHSETLTNKGVISLSAAGLSTGIITTKISTSTCAFDLSTNGLLALKQAGVKDEVIATMMENAGSNAGTVSAPRSKPGRTSGSAPKLETANHPYARNRATGVWSPLEKTTASIKSKMVAMGYGGTKFLYQIPEEKSTTRLAATDSVFFLINTMGTAVPELALYRTKPENGKRAAVGSQVKMTGIESGQDVLTFNVVSVGNGVFRLVPSKKLPPGEYFFAGKSVANAATADAYAFGLD